MRFKRPLAVLTLASLAVATASFALEPTTAPTTAPAAKSMFGGKEKPIRLTVPWNKVKDLTPEQTSQINAIHVETIDKIKALEAAEDEQCMAVLSDEQRKAMQDTVEQEKADKKAAKKKS